MSKRTGPSALRGSKAAKQALVAILETLTGTCSTTEAAERLGISHSRYYQLEMRALQGMLTALEPRPRGPQQTPSKVIRTLRSEKQALERDLRRAQGLLRAAARSVGLPASATRKKKHAKRRRKKARGKTVMEALGGKEEARDGTDELQRVVDREDRSQ